MRLSAINYGQKKDKFFNDLSLLFGNSCRAMFNEFQKSDFFKELGNDTQKSSISMEEIKNMYDYSSLDQINLKFVDYSCNKEMNFETYDDLLKFINEKKPRILGEGTTILSENEKIIACFNSGKPCSGGATTDLMIITNNCKLVQFYFGNNNILDGILNITELNYWIPTKYVSLLEHIYTISSSFIKIVLEHFKEIHSFKFSNAGYNPNYVIKENELIKKNKSIELQLEMNRKDMLEFNEQKQNFETESKKQKQKFDDEIKPFMDIIQEKQEIEKTKNELQEIWKEIRIEKAKLKQVQIKLELDRIDVQKKLDLLNNLNINDVLDN
jgi:hypothetical protein